MIIVLMGVAGSGKTTIGELLAVDLKWQFFDGDDFHSPESLNKMKQGTALNDSDRKPWLDRLQKQIAKADRQGSNIIIACSALKKSYRDYLQKDHTEVIFVHLRGDFSLILKRLEQRAGHFYKADLLPSQFAELEEPTDALTINVSMAPSAVVQFIKSRLKITAVTERNLSLP